MPAPDQQISTPHGSAALWWRQVPQLGDERLGLIGAWSPGDNGVELLATCCQRLQQAGCTLAVGPMDGSTWQSYRLLTWRGSHPPFALEPNTPDDWPEQWLAAGFMVDATYHSALIEPILLDDPRLLAVEQRLTDSGLRLRELDPQCYGEELRRIHGVALRAFADNYLYTPLREEEFVAQYTAAQHLLRPGLCWLAERDGQCVGFVFAIPDFEQQRRGQPVDTLVVKTLAVLPGRSLAGLGKLLTVRCHAGGARLGLTRAIHALMHDGNASRNTGGQSTIIRRYTLYRKRLL